MKTEPVRHKYIFSKRNNLNIFIVPFVIYRGSNLKTMVSHLFSTWSYSFALINKFIFGLNEEWQATGSRKVNKSRSYNIVIISIISYFILLSILLIYGFQNHPQKEFLFYAALSWFIHLVGISYLFSEKLRRT